MQSPPVPRYLVPPRSKYSPQHLITEKLVNEINAEDKPKSDVADRQRKKRNELLYRKLLLGELDRLSE